MAAPRAIVLAQRAESCAVLTALAADLPWAAHLHLSFEPLSCEREELRAAVLACRERERSLPIGVIAEDEAGVLLALEGGADEATSADVTTATQLSAFIDRLELRARVRAEGEHLREAFSHSEKLTALGTLVAGIGHEINNPLSVMLLSIEAARHYWLPACEASFELARAARAGEPLPADALVALRKHLPEERSGRDARRILEDISEAANSVASIVRDLRTFARTDQEEPSELLEISDVIDHALRLVGRDVFHHALLERDYEADLPRLVAPRNRLSQVIINLLINAAHAIREIDRPNHRIGIRVRTDDEFVAIVISDTGPGIPPDSLERIFDPFYTTKRNELGTGLGLAISRAILQRLGGDLVVESVFGDGATFMCFLPLPTHDEIIAAVSRTRHTGQVLKPPSQASRSVLVVDDDERVLRSYVRVLSPEHRVLIAQDGDDAIELLESGSAPDMVLLELDLPGRDGAQLLAWLGMHRPELRDRALVVTSAASQKRYESFLRSHEGPVLHKPIRGDELLAEITRMAG